MALGMTMTCGRHASTHKWALQHVWCATCGRNGMGHGTTYPSLVLAPGHSILCTETVCEAMAPILWHNGATTNVTNLNEWLYMAQGRNALCIGTINPWMKCHDSLLRLRRLRHDTRCCYTKHANRCGGAWLAWARHESPCVPWAT